ncbi:unnamed protein product [Adineta steineri]|uniref:Right handed beta helix domain-containing protein n=1 Tax=Adineta steineri TaxID=433720 RepID=A0A814SZK4_9BILA|nr:unnamed protein product [Adineta steineri]
MAGLVIQPELWWGEGNYTERITIRNNTFMKCGYATSDNDSVHVVLDGLRNILIKENYFYNGQHRVNNRGVDHSIDDETLVYINRAQSLTLERNRAWCSGDAYKKRL